MTTYLRGRELLGPLRDALGIDKPVRSITLTVPLDGVVTVAVEYVETKDKVKAIVDAVNGAREYRA